MNRKVIGRDVRKTMMGAFMLYAARKVAEGLVMVEIVDYLGSMADEVLLYGHNAKVGMYVGMVGALLALVFFVPLLETFAELLMFKQSLPYCERVLKAFLKKPYSELMKMDAGDAEYRVEQDPIDFYCAYSDVFTNTLAVPIVGAFLLFRIKDINVLYILGAFLLAWIRVLLPVFFQKKLGEFDKEKREFTTELRSAEMIFSERTETFVTLGIGMPWIKHMDELFRNYYIKVGRRFGAFKARYTNLKKTVSLLN